MINKQFLLLMGLIFLIAIIYAGWDKISDVIFPRKKKRKIVRICPKCGSTDTSYDLGLEATASRFSRYIYKCNKCSHSGQAFPEMNEEEFKKYQDKSKNKGEYINICPNCGSTDIHTDFTKHYTWAWGTPPLLKCKKCSSTYPSFPEIEKSEVEKFRKNLKKKCQSKKT